MFGVYGSRKHQAHTRGFPPPSHPILPECMAPVRCVSNAPDALILVACSALVVATSWTPVVEHRSCSSAAAEDGLAGHRSLLAHASARLGNDRRSSMAVPDAAARPNDAEAPLPRPARTETDGERNKTAKGIKWHIPDGEEIPVTSDSEDPITGDQVGEIEDDGNGTSVEGAETDDEDLQELRTRNHSRRSRKRKRHSF
mmetsp:Transcript_30730/g.56024  ORF Transcript_30730/g.56024 Transcript_30730/m.56024 type:complete len:199 (-) Transcript_30730:106-702(-)